MQFRSLWYICHAPNYCFVLLCIALYYFGLLCIWLHSKPYRYYGPYTLGPLRHALCHHCMEFWSLSERMPSLSYMQFCSLRDIYPAIIACSFWACNTYGMSSLHAVLKLVGLCHTTIICRPGLHKAPAMPSLSAFSELARHMPCPRLLLCIALYSELILYTTSYHVAL
jgi:hypothetical protein